MHRLRTGIGAGVAVTLLVVLTGHTAGQNEGPAEPTLVSTEDPAVMTAGFGPLEEWMGEPRQLAFGPDGTLWLWDGTALWQAGWPGSRVSHIPVEEVHDLAVALDDTLWVASRNGLWSLRGNAWDRTWSGAVYGIEIGPDGTVLAIGGGMRGDPDHEGFSLIRVGASGRSTEAVEVLAPAAWPTGIAVPRDGGVWISSVEPGWGFVGLALEDGLLLRYDGETWAAMQPLSEATAFGAVGLAVGPDGSLWSLLRVPTVQDQSEPHLVQLVGSDWVPASPDDGLPHDIGMRVGALAVDGTGRVWTLPGEAGDSQGIASFDGRSWHRHLPGTAIADMTVGPDGAIWTAGSSGIHVIRPGASMPTE